MRIQFIAVLLALAAALPLSAVEAPVAGEAVYLMVLGNRAAEPDLPALGGRVLQSWSDRRLVAIPADRADTLRQHKGVSWVQRIWMGESMDEPPAPSLQPHAAVLQIAAAPPAWTTGTYSYDASGNIKGNRRSESDYDSYAYDAVGRLTAATIRRQIQTVTGPQLETREEAYTFDPFGNLKQLGSLPLGVNAQTNRLDSFQYDTVGNVTVDSDGRAYHYDALAMTTAIDLPPAEALDGDLRMIYTADDERIVVAGRNTTRYRVRDYAKRVLREWKSAGSSVLEWERDYIHAGGALVAGEVQIDQRRNPMRHYHSDHLGSTRMVTDGAGELVARHDYYPFGAEIPSTDSEYLNTGKAPRDPRKFTSHERDYFSVANADGGYVDYMHARYYGAKWGRFLSVDPGGRDARKPQSWNRYAYVENNPLIRFDPDGREFADLLEYISARLTKAQEHYNKSNAAMKEIPIVKLTAGGKIAGWTFQAGPLKGEARVDVRVGTMKNAKVPVELRAAVSGGAQGSALQMQTRAKLTGEAGVVGRWATLENVGWEPPETVFGRDKGTTEPSAGVKTQAAKVMATFSLWGVTLDAGVDLEQAATWVGEMGQAWSAVTSSFSPMKDRDY